MEVAGSELEPDSVPPDGSPPREAPLVGESSSSASQTEALPPWEVPPGEEYWQALLSEGEYGESSVVPVGHERSRAERAKSSTILEPNPGPQSPTSDLANWDMCASYLAEERTIELTVASFNRGGLLVKWNGITGFVPASQLYESVPYDDDVLRRESLSQRVGCTLTLKVIEVDSAKDRLILSERAARRITGADLELLDELDAGQVRQGRVTNLCGFGAFVDLGGVEGLIHISELSWGRVSYPSDVLQKGQEVDVYILNVDRELGRVGLSLKRLRPDPWNTVESQYQIGQVVRGVVTNVVNFGAFVRIEEGLEGLVHASELTGDSVAHDQHLHEGDEVQVRITSIEALRHRIGLSLHDEPT
jgi:small subunit ribosomal protein S1